MKYPVHYYAQALAESVAAAKPAQEAKIVKNFLALVQKNGDAAHLYKIVEEAARMARAKAGVRKVTLETARTLDKRQRDILKTFIKPGDISEEKINAELIAGVNIIIDGERRFDGSLKGKLDRLFKGI